MSEEFHYPDGKHAWLREQLPTHPYPREKFLSDNRPHWYTQNQWDAIDYDEDNSRKTIYVWIDEKNQREITPISKRNGPHLAASELFLEAMRPHIQQAITYKEEGVFDPSGKIDKTIIRFDEKITNLWKFVTKLPVYIRCELDSRLVDQLEKTLVALSVPARGPIHELPKGAFKRRFLKIMLLEYKKYFGRLPGHTKNQPFNGVASDICGLARFSPKGMADELAEVKANITN